MSYEQVGAYLKQFNAEDRMISFTVSSATVALAAQALHVEEARIAKTLSFLLKDDACLLLVAAGDARIDNQKFKAVFHEKARMLPLERVEEMTGHPVGGVCPFAVKEGVPVYLDASLKRFQTVFPAVGTASSAIELTNDELLRFSNARGYVDVCKDWQGSAESEKTIA